MTSLSPCLAGTISPSTSLASPDATDMWTPSNATLLNYSCSSYAYDNQSSLSTTEVYNESMSHLASLTSFKEIPPLSFRLTGSWDETTQSEKDVCIEKASEACQVICEVIAPNAGEELFQAMNSTSDIHVSEELAALMTAYKNATTRNLKLQILSIYAHNYPAKTLMKLHEPYATVTMWQIRKARLHARQSGPGNIIETQKYSRIRIDRIKLDHFIAFADRPYFYQDVAYGTRKLKLNSGQTLTMPNIIRNVTRSTLIQQYFKHCEEEEVEPLSRATLFRVLEVREASERKSLQGIDNISAEGSNAFEKLRKIVIEMESLGLARTWVENSIRKLNNAILYLRTDYSVHCKEQSPCPDHCRSFALSDSKLTCFQNSCNHEHNFFCDRCEELKFVLSEIENIIQTHSSTMYSNEQKEDYMHDFGRCKENILKWKCHILRSCNQEMAKQNVLEILDENSALIVMDWAMKFTQRRFREKQSEWYAKRGMSWHVSSVITRNLETSQLEVCTYVHLMDSCTQDWYSVLSLLENLLQVLHQSNVKLSKVYLRSDEAGCYHNNFLPSSLKDLGQRVGIKVMRYDFSEPQHGKDVCDRIICPMKHAIQKYCNEGHDILTASDMRRALVERPVSGTTASVNQIDCSSITIKVKNIDGISTYHNFEFEDTGIRVWKAFGIGEGRLLPFKNILINPQLSTNIQQKEQFSKKESRPVRPDERRNTEDGLFECSIVGCGKVFRRFEDLELHLDVGKHENTVQSESLYDQLRRDWAEKFLTIDCRKKSKNADVVEPMGAVSSDQNACENSMGWALSKSRAGSIRFSQNVRDYLTERYDLGEITGMKSNPSDVENDMRNARNERNEKRFSRDEWLTATQIKNFFSRLSAARKKHGNEKARVLMSDLESSDDEDLLAIAQDICDQELVDSILERLDVQHPIVYDVYNLCDYFRKDKLNVFSVKMLKSICKEFELPFKSKDLKSSLIEKVRDMLAGCTCNS